MSSVNACAGSIYRDFRCDWDCGDNEWGELRFSEDEAIARLSIPASADRTIAIQK